MAIFHVRTSNFRIGVVTGPDLVSTHASSMRLNEMDFLHMSNTHHKRNAVVIVRKEHKGILMIDD